MRLFFFLLTLGVATFAVGEELTSIDVFHTGGESINQLERVRGIKPMYFNLNNSVSLQKQVNQNLPSNISDAAEYMRSYANSTEGKATIKLIVEGYQGVGEAFRLGVRELPAVVINKKYVVYGAININQALRLAEKKGKLSGG